MISRLTWLAPSPNLDSQTVRCKPITSKSEMLLSACTLILARKLSSALRRGWKCRHPRPIFAQVRFELTRTSSTRSSQQFIAPSQLHTAAFLSCLSGLAYRTEEELASELEVKGMQLVASGHNAYTRWYVADGPWQRDHAGNVVKHSSGRVVLCRGVVWRAPEVDAFKLWQQLARCWPVEFLPDLTRPTNALLAHAGVAGIAAPLFEELAPLLVGEGTVYAGHSLGGAIAVLLCCTARARLGSAAPWCYTFGSPPVLVANSGLDNPGALKALGLAEDSFQHFILDQDPVPRAMLSVDPSLTLLRRLIVGAPAKEPTGSQDSAPETKRDAAGASYEAIPAGAYGGAQGQTEGPGWLSRALGPLLELPRGLMGGTPARFLFDLPLGHVYLLRWQEHQHKVQRLTGHDVEAHLGMIPDEFLSQPMKAVQALLDHSHTSYTTDLRAAARYAARQQQSGEVTEAGHTSIK